MRHHPRNWKAVLHPVETKDLLNQHTSMRQRAAQAAPRRGREGVGGTASADSAGTRSIHRDRAHRRYVLVGLDHGQPLLASSNASAASSGGHRAVSAIALLPRLRLARERALAMGLARRPGANVGASRGPAAGKKLPRNPRLKDQQQALSPRPQGIRSLRR